MTTVSYRKYSGKKQANIKPMIILMGVVGAILVISLVTVVVMKVMSSEDGVKDGQTEVSAPNVVGTPNQENAEEKKVVKKIVIRIAEKEFTATLEETETAQAFAALLPFEKNMAELNGNEKYYDLHQNLPSEPKQVGRIEAGDLMLFQNNFVVVFYKTHSTSYSYTRIGKIDDPTGLAEAVGSGDVVMSFAVMDEAEE